MPATPLDFYELIKQVDHGNHDTKTMKNAARILQQPRFRATAATLLLKNHAVVNSPEEGLLFGILTQLIADLASTKQGIVEDAVRYIETGRANDICLMCGLNPNFVYDIVYKLCLLPRLPDKSLSSEWGQL